MGWFAGVTASGACLLAVTALLAACGEQNTYVAPPPPKVDVALPLQQSVTPYRTATGNTAAVNTTTLVARVSGFIQEIDYKDGDEVKAGTRLFLIEPQPYQLALDQAKAGQGSADASTRQSGAELKRQQELLAKSVASQSAVDQQTAAAAVDTAKQQQSAVDVKQAELNLSYTEVKAPFDGIVTARQVSLGQLVGAGSPTTLATIVQLDPIFVTFNIVEPDVLRIRAAMAKRGMTAQDLKKVPVEVGLQNETGYPHKARSIMPGPSSRSRPARCRSALSSPIRPAAAARLFRPRPHSARR